MPVGVSLLATRINIGLLAELEAADYAGPLVIRLTDSRTPVEDIAYERQTMRALFGVWLASSKCLNRGASYCRTRSQKRVALGLMKKSKTDQIVGDAMRFAPRQDGHWTSHG